MKPMPSVTAFALKVAAIVGMTCNHIANVFGSELPGGAMVALYSLGGLTFPIMAYLLCDGYQTHLQRATLRRATRRVRSCLANSLFAAVRSDGQRAYYAAYRARDAVACRPPAGRISPCARWASLEGLAVSSFCDWGIIGPLMILLFWHFHDRPRGVALAMLVPFLGLGLPALSWAISDPVPLSLGVLGYYTVGFGLATALMLNYNGQRGRPLKWFFYGYYPGHLLALWALAQALAL